MAGVDPNVTASKPGALARVPLARVLLAGALMGWANLVPGVSGGTMLLACGVYPAFIAAVTNLTRLRLRAETLLWVATLAAGGAAAVLVTAGMAKALVESQPVAMHSLFIGLTLGGVPLVVRRARPLSAAVWFAGGFAFALMVVLALLRGSGEDAAPGVALVFCAGVLGASAMVLPGLSGSYLLLLMGLYLPVLGAIESLRHALVDPLLGGHAADIAFGGEALAVLVPFGLGVAVGIAAVSHLIRIALERAPAATYGLLLGLLLGAVPGLWPFGAGAAALSAGNAALFLVCLAVGFFVTYALRHVKPAKESSHP